MTWLWYISEWVGDVGGDSCCWYTGIGIFGVKSTPFRLGFEVEGLADIKSWLNEYLEVGLNSTWIVQIVTQKQKGDSKATWWKWKARKETYLLQSSYTWKKMKDSKFSWSLESRL